MLENTVPNVQNIPSRLVTAGEVDKQYKDIYSALYTTKVLDHEEVLLKAIMSLSIDLCMYLRTRELEAINVRVKVSMGYSSHCILIFITLYFNGFSVMLRLLDYDDYLLSSIPIYRVLACSEDGTVYGSRRCLMGVEFLAYCIISMAGAHLCETCYYSDEGIDYCGLGMEMYTTSCRKRVPINRKAGSNQMTWA